MKHSFSILVFMIYLQTVDCQSWEVIDTFSSSHSKYGFVYGVEISEDYYYLSYNDYRSIYENFDKDSILSRYSPIRSFFVPIGGDSDSDIRTSSFAMERIICKDTFNFNIPISHYRLSIENLLKYGISLNSHLDSNIISFGQLRPMIINFYKKHQSFHSITLPDQEITGVEMSSLYKKIKFDKIEIVVSNEFDDVFHMTFFLD